jgi:dTDP-4-dehydrorhamnose 3,5-epimerase
VIVDLREGSPTYRKWEAFTLLERNHIRLYISPGFIHGFLTLSQNVVFAYKHGALFEPAREFSVRWNDPTLEIPRAVNGAPQVSARDKNAPLLETAGGR